MISSKVVSRHRELMAKLAVDAVLAVATVGGDGNWDVEKKLKKMPKPPKPHQIYRFSTKFPAKINLN